SGLVRGARAVTGAPVKATGGPPPPCVPSGPDGTRPGRPRARGASADGRGSCRSTRPAAPAAPVPPGAARVRLPAERAHAHRVSQPGRLGAARLDPVAQGPRLGQFPQEPGASPAPLRLRLGGPLRGGARVGARRRSVGSGAGRGPRRITSGILLRHRSPPQSVPPTFPRTGGLTPVIGW